MRTVGQVLKEEREKKFYTLEEIEKATKIRKELLEALEAGVYTKLPPPTFVQGFIKNYGKFLKLDSDKLLAIFRREFAEKSHPSRVLDSFANPYDNKRFKLTPARFLAGVVIVLVIIFFIYLWFEYRFLTEGPFLEVTNPADQSGISSPAVLVTGRTDTEAKVSINNQDISIDTAGKFSQEIQLSDNINTIEIKAVSKTGKATNVVRTVFLKR